MNSLTNLEATLRGFKPRKPSRKLRERLFPTRSSGRLELTGRPLLASGIWVAPLTATAMLLLSLATAWPPESSDPGALTLAGRPSAWVGVPTEQVERNAPPRPNFRSTTPGGLSSSFGSLLLRQTNVFAR
ncbi:MAG: hypothetical protein AB7J34_14950 [Limisphaerales bacterium]